MAHQAATPEPTSSPFQTLRTAAVPRIGSIVAANKDTRRRLLFLSCVLVILVAALVTVATLGVYISSHWSKQRGSADDGGNSFCCPDDAANVARFVNATIRPCRNFFQHVCADGFRQGLWKHDGYRAKLEKIMVTGLLPKGLQRVEAAEFIIAFYKTCLVAIRNSFQLLFSMATNLVKKNRNLLTRPNSTNAFVYAVIASAKYGLHSFIDFTYNPTASQVYLNISDRCHDDSISYHFMATSIITFRNTLDANITLEDLLRMHRKICRQFLALGPTETHYSTLNGSDVFDRNIWDFRDLQAAFSAIGYSLGNETEINVAGGSKIRVLYDVFSTDAYGSRADVKGALLLSDNVKSGYEQFYASHDGSWQYLFQACNRSVSTIDTVWQLFTAEILTTPDKDKQAIEAFAAVKKAVFWDCRRSSLFEHADVRKLENLFKDFTLVTPAAANAGPVTLPKPTSDFTENLLRGRSFSYDATRARLWGVETTGMLQTHRMTVLSGKYFVLPASFYDVIRPGSPTSEIPNMASLGWLLAETMWFVVLHSIKWDGKTRANLEELRACFVRSYLGTDADRFMTNVTMAASIGLSSLLSAFHRPDWNTLRIVLSVLKMSHGQLFYALATFLRCPLEPYPEEVRYGNVPLMYVDDFATVFHCSPESPMAKHGLCPILRR